MATKPKVTLSTTEVPFVIEALRKLALQRDTLRKYSLDEESDKFDEEQADAYTEDIASIRQLLVALGDQRPIVLKSERKAKAKKNAKAKAKAKPKAKAVATK
jgi:hypothetical protein